MYIRIHLYVKCDNMSELFCFFLSFQLMLLVQCDRGTWLISFAAAPVSSCECPWSWKLSQVCVFRIYIHVPYVLHIHVCPRILARVPPTLGAISGEYISCIFSCFRMYMYVLYMYVCSVYMYVMVCICMFACSCTSQAPDSGSYLKYLCSVYIYIYVP